MVLSSHRDPKTDSRLISATPTARDAGQESHSRYVRTGRWLCFVGAAIGAFGLLSGAVGTTFLTAILPNRPQMYPNAAFAILLMGIAGALRARKDIRGPQWILSVLAATVVLTIGLGTLAEYALNLDLRINQLFLGHDADPRIGRPAPMTALALTFLSSALLVFDLRPTARTRPSEWLILGAGFTAFTALLGFAFNTGLLYRWPRVPTAGVALPAAIALLSISLGLLFERPTRGVMRVVTSEGPGGVLLRRLVLPSMLAPVLVGLVVTHEMRLLDVEELSTVLAILASAMTMLGLFLLIVTAVPLNRVHEALEVSRMQTRALIEQAPDGIFIANLEGYYTDVNSTGCQMFGYSREEIVGKPIVELLPAEDIERLLWSKSQMLKGEVVVGEWKMRKKDGTLLPVEVSSNILPDGRWQALVRDVSERKQLEKSLQRSNDDLNRAQAVANIGSWRIDLGTEALCWSAEAYRIFGVPLGTPMTHERFISCVHPDDRSCVNEAWTHAVHGQLYDIEYRIIAEGRIKWVREKANLEFDEHGNFLSGFGITHDITERKQREEALRIAEAKSSGIVSISADAIISIDEEQRITLFNEGAEKTFGYSKEEAIGAPLDILIAKRFRALHHEHVKRFALGPDTARRTGHRALSGLRKNGEEFSIDAAISKLEVDGTKILTVALRDITEQKRVEKEQSFLAEFGSELALTLDYQETARNVARLVATDLADLCVVDVTEEDGKIRRLVAVHRDPNKAVLAQRLQNVELDRRQPYLGSDVFETKKPFLISHITTEYLDALAQSEEHRQILHELEVSSLVAVPLLAHGRIVGSMTVIRSQGRFYTDVDVRLIEKAAFRAALAVDSARLYQIAQRAIDSRDEVLGIVAHDLRNPLNAILMQANLLQRSGAVSNQSPTKSAEMIERSVNRMNRLIRDLLDVTRIEGGRLIIEPDRVPSRQIVLDCIDAQKLIASSAAVHLRSEMTPVLEDVWGDRDRLFQIFDNLIGNAIKFTKPGGCITVGAKSRADSVLFWVTDTGMGIYPDDLPHVFERFWQTRKSERRGAGLGLPIVKGLVEAHGGRIWAESTLGEGSTFYFTIPTVTHDPRTQSTSWS